MSVTHFHGNAVITVEIGFAASLTGTAAVWDTSLWNTGTWGLGLEWTDISAYVRRFSTNRGRQRSIDSFRPGTASLVLDNADGRFSPDNLSGPYVVGGITQIEPLRPIRITARYSSGSTRPVYYGYIQSWTETYPAKKDAIVTVACADGLSLISAVNRWAVTEVGAGERAGARIHRILDSVNWTDPRYVDVGESTMQATTLANNALTEIDLVTASEGGFAYVDADGAFIFREYFNRWIANSFGTPVAFGNNPDEIAYADIEFDYSTDTMTNVANVAIVGGTQQTVADNDSRSRYGDRTWQRNDLICEAPAHAYGIATRRVEADGVPERRVKSITVSALRTYSSATAALRVPQLDQLLALTIGQAVTVYNRLPTHTITSSCYIEGIAHSVNPEGDWVVKLSLGKNADNPNWGKWDSMTWDSGSKVLAP